MELRRRDHGSRKESKMPSYRNALDVGEDVIQRCEQDRQPLPDA